MISRKTALLCALLLGACTSSNNDSGSIVTGSGPGANDQAKVELPQCPHPLGTVALVERQISVLEEMGLSSPLPLLNTMVSQSNCFQIVDQAAAQFAKRSGKKGPTPDYLLSADILAQNPNSGGFDTGAISSFIPGIAGSVAGSLSVKTSDVKTALYLSDTKTGLQVASVTGHAQSADVGASISRFARTDVKLRAYNDTPIGKTTAAAFLDAYVKLVNHVKGSGKVAKR